MNIMYPLGSSYQVWAPSQLIFIGKTMIGKIKSTTNLVNLNKLCVMKVVDSLCAIITIKKERTFAPKANPLSLNCLWHIYQSLLSFIELLKKSYENTYGKMYLKFDSQTIATIKTFTMVPEIFNLYRGTCTFSLES
jgi:hypothetical protein